MSYNFSFYQIIGFVSNISIALLTLVFLACSCVAKGNTPIFPEKSSFPHASNLRQAKATKNMTFPMKFLFLQMHIESFHLVASSNPQISLSCTTTSHQYE